MTRITRADLERRCTLINKVTGSPAEQFDAEGRLAFGHHHLEGAYGGWRVERITLNGGTFDALGTGYVPKAALYDAMLAYMAGVEVGRKLPPAVRV